MVLGAAVCVLRATAEYYAALIYCLATRCNIERVPLLQRDTAALVHVYSLAKTLQLWDAPHYRAPSFAHDLRDNLKNVAIPGTGARVPLSVFCTSRAAALLFLLLVNPIASAMGALYLVATEPRGGGYGGGYTSGGTGGLAAAAAAYRELLLAPRHWLASWRLNCVLVAWHAAAGGSPRDYGLEDKGPFLLEADRLGLPVAPFIKAPRVFVKHRSGIHVFDNFTAGGDWVISEALDNAPAIAAMLPRGAPLSTVVTASVVWLEEREARRASGGAGPAPPAAGIRAPVLGPGAAAAGAGAPLAPAPAPAPAPPPAAPADGAPALSPLLREARAPPPWARTPSPRGPRGASRSPSPGIRSLLAGRRSRASRPSSPPLPVSTAVQHAGGTPRPRGSDDGSGGAGWHSPTCGGEGSSSASDAVYERSIEVLTSVFRAGLAGANTDHVSICFPVDESGELGRGVTANHWYRVGWRYALRVPASARDTWEEHPQSGHLIAGQVIPDWWQSAAGLALQAHALLMPGVPLVGWDVALPAEGGPCLLELNISCNLFNGDYDREGYADLLASFFAELGRAEEEQRRQQRQQQRRGAARGRRDA
ncbi:MAG: hypothetical protein J3K34DRAFT_477654 [Monoraphidium minutum]|nr:MAG: hypothetical protein J3K34DRAFT_477654 [Monoraphidium minutum]